MRTQARYLTTLFAAAGVCAAIAVAPVAVRRRRSAPTPVRTQRCARPTAAAQIVTSPPIEQQLVRRLALGRRICHRPRRLGHRLVTPV